MIITTPGSDQEFDQIHKLNYQTFVEEIPQHRRNPDGSLVDKFHYKNKWLVAKEGDKICGMVCYNLERPFSLDGKLRNLDQFLPSHKSLAEVRLLAIDKTKRGNPLAYRLLKELCSVLIQSGVDAAVISGTTRQLSLYHKMGFIPFGSLLGTPDAVYQPMYITVNQLRHDFKNH
jgi:N-acyl-L-homoserine lactone synthetase